MADMNRLIQQLGESSTTQAAVQALTNEGAPAVEPLIAALRSPNDMIRRQAAQVLVNIGDPRAVPALFELTNDSQMTVRSSAVHLLGTISADARVPDFLSQMVRDGQRPPDIRVSAVFAVGRLKGQDATHALWLELLHDADEQVVANAASQLANSKKPEVVEPLITALKRVGEGRFAFGSILRALADLGDKRAFEPIAVHLKAADPHKRGSAIAALKTLGDSRALDLLEPLQGDNAIAWEEDRGPKVTVGQVAREAIAAIQKANGIEPKKSRWKFW